MRLKFLQIIPTLVGLVLLGYIATPAEAQSCIQGAGYSVAGFGNTGSYGFQGNFLTNDPTTTCGWFVNGGVYWPVDIWKWVEAGWLESPGKYPSDPNGKHPFTFWNTAEQDPGQWYVMTWVSINPGTYHTYKVVSRLNADQSCSWDFYYDGNFYKSWWHPFCAGATWAQQERWNNADGDVNGVPSGSSHLRYLQKFNSSRIGSYWTVFTEYDSDAEYKRCPISNYEFRVKPYNVAC